MTLHGRNVASVVAVAAALLTLPGMAAAATISTGEAEWFGQDIEDNTMVHLHAKIASGCADPHVAYTVQYGRTSAYGRSVSDNGDHSAFGDAEFEYSNTVEDLTPGVVYHYRGVADVTCPDPSQTATVYGAERCFQESRLQRDGTYNVPCSTASHPGKKPPKQTHRKIKIRAKRCALPTHGIVPLGIRSHKVPCRLIYGLLNYNARHTGKYGKYKRLKLKPGPFRCVAIAEDQAAVALYRCRYKRPSHYFYFTWDTYGLAKWAKHPFGGDFDNGLN
jgi:hypothetical protein